MNRLGLVILLATTVFADIPDSELRPAAGMVGLNLWENATMDAALMVGNPFTITVMGPADARKAFISDVDPQGILQVGPWKAPATKVNPLTTITVSMALRQVTVAGANNVTFMDKISGSDLTLTASGSSHVKSLAVLEPSFLVVNASGSAWVNLKLGNVLMVDITVNDNAQVTIFAGKASAGKVVVRGSGKLVASGFAIDVVSAELYDKGSADLNVVKKMLVKRDQTAVFKSSSDEKTIRRINAVAGKTKPVAPPVGDGCTEFGCPAG